MGAAKAWLEIAGQPLLAHTLRPFLHEARVACIVVALNAQTAASPPDWLTRIDPRVCLVAGGEARADSVRLALAAVPADCDVVLVHDAARPLVSQALVARMIDHANEAPAVIAALPLTDTVHEVDAGGCIVRTPDRAGLWLAQTPQAFATDVLREAHRRAQAEGIGATDDAALVRRYGHVVRVVEGERSNIKLTVPEDLATARALLERS